MGNSLNCLEQCRPHQEQQQRLLVLQQGAHFKRKKYLLGIASGTEKINLRLSNDERRLLWKPVEGQKGPTSISVDDVHLIKVQGSTAFTVVSRKGDTLLDLEAENEELRDLWVTNLQLLCEDSEDVEVSAESAAAGSKFRKMVEERSKKQAYWAQRTQELEDRKKEAEERKKQFAGAGMKYTANAMINRSTS
ncbi:hypothetical protein Poli38472_003347 [Pythium oligandrum]|uniref:PH domain-containing protein n=1 Tax=Pythium oligandrum TaxID=41045 RepID=A0A8K1FF89_PYTOL|nr:hypothetical protein Poli38472_003347 [Pythium oligandrum]|eukprot:TMW57422.1 hypothetical protein Poli38472_003347 [Pythium oligandrum]